MIYYDSGSPSPISGNVIVDFPLKFVNESICSLDSDNNRYDMDLTNKELNTFLIKIVTGLDGCLIRIQLQSENERQTNINITVSPISRICTTYQDLQNAQTEIINVINQKLKGASSTEIDNIIKESKLSSSWSCCIGVVILLIIVGYYIFKFLGNILF